MSSKINMEPKFRAVSKLNPEAVILVNPPEADDPRAKKLFISGKPYLDDIRKGHYLIIVDVDREEQRKKVHRLLDHSLDVERQGDESAFSPLL